jgi:polysaccharide chain length determinant protein (PEP-CTERM system associated)
MQEPVKQLLATLRGMWKFRWPSVLVAWIIAAIGVVVVWRIPDQFEASARVYVDTDSILKPLMTGLTVQPNVEQQIGMLSRTLISRPNIEKLIRMADLDLRATSKTDQDALVERLMKDIEIRTAGGVNLYSMAYKAEEPGKAKRVIQSLVSIFVESGLGASRKDTDSAKTFLSEQIKAFEAKLEEAEARMKEFQLRNLDGQGAGGKDTATRLAETHAQLEAAQLQLREAQHARDAARRQLAEARGQVSGRVALPDLLAGKSNDEGPVAGVVTPEIDARIDAQKRTLDGLLQRYTEQHPDVVSTRRLISDLTAQKRSEVAEMLKRTAAQPKGVPGSPGGPSESLVVQELNRMISTAEVQVASLQARVDEFGGRYAQIRQSLRSAPQLEAEAAQLNRDYAITKKNYEDLVARRQSAVMSGELDVASGVAEFRLIDPPRVAPKPVSPNRFLLLPLVLVAALGAGATLALALSQLRPTFSDPEQLREATGMPLLGVVTALTTDGDRRYHRASLMRFLAASGGLVGLFIAGLIAMTLTGRSGL